MNSIVFFCLIGSAFSVPIDVLGGLNTPHAPQFDSTRLGPLRAASDSLPLTRAAHTHLEDTWIPNESKPVPIGTLAPPAHTYSIGSISEVPLTPAHASFNDRPALPMIPTTGTMLPIAETIIPITSVHHVQLRDTSSAEATAPKEEKVVVHIFGR